MERNLTVVNTFVTKFVTKVNANHAKGFQVKSNTVLAIEEQSKNYFVRRGLNALTQSPFVTTLVRSFYHVESTSVLRSVILMIVKDVK